MRLHYTLRKNDAKERGGVSMLHERCILGNKLLNYADQIKVIAEVLSKLFIFQHRYRCNLLFHPSENSLQPFYDDVLV